MVGASFSGLTVITKLVLVEALPSLTLRVMIELPYWFGAGVTVTVRWDPVPARRIFAWWTKVVLDDSAVTTSDPAAVSTSPTVKAREPVDVSSLITLLATALIVGASFTAVTVRRNVSDAVASPLLTVTVIRLLPVWFAKGVTDTVRDPPLPPNTMFPFKTKPVLLEPPETLREEAGVIRSEMVHAIGPVLPSSAMVTPAIALMVGGMRGKVAPMVLSEFISKDNGFAVPEALPVQPVKP